MFCSNCGSRLADGARFCSECGARVARADEPEIRTIQDIDFQEPKIEETPVKEVSVEAAAKPSKGTISFDWSNVVDEPHKKEVKEIKSPWGTTGSIDEKELYAEMTPTTGRSRTMSFIDVLKAEKEEKERAAADRSIEYTEVLEFDPDLTAFEEPPSVQIAPLYEDVDEPIKTPFDEPEFAPEPFFKDEPRFEEPAPAEPEMPEVPAVFEEPAAEPEMPEVPVAAEEPAAEPEPSIELSRETIAQFDEFVKSFEKEAGIGGEPAFEEPVYEEPSVSAPKFELPDFLKSFAGFTKIAEEKPAAEEEVPAPAAAEEPAAEEPAFEAPAAEEPFFESDEPPVIELEDEEPAAEEPVFEEPVFEEPKYEESTEEEDSMEDLYLDIDTSAPVGERATSRLSLYEEDDDDDDEDEFEEETETAEEFTPIDEEELFREMEESRPASSGMTIAPPADKESEIEALRKRLAELTGVMDPVEPAGEAEDAEPETELFEGPVDDFFESEYYNEPDEASVAEEPAVEEPAAEAPAEEPVVEEAEPVAEEHVAEPEPAVEEAVEDIYLQDVPEEAAAEVVIPAVAVEEVAEEPVAEEPVVEEAEPVAEEPVVEEAEPVVEEAPAEAAEFAFQPEVTPDIDEMFALLIPASKAAEPEAAAEEAVEDIYLQDVPEEAAAEVVIPAIEEVAEEPAVEEPVEAPAVEEPVVEVPVFVAPVVEEIAEEPAAVEPVVEVPAEESVVEAPVFEVPVVEPAEEPVVEAPVIEEAAEEAAKPKETDALSLEELEKDLFGDALPEEAEAEETKKIDKFYTLYRKNEEFQRLLDEEYERLKHGGGLTEEEKKAVDVVPKMAEVEEAIAAAATTPAAAPAAEPEIAAEDKKAYRQIEDETIYMPKELLAEEAKAALAAGAATAAAAGGFVAVTADPANKAPAEVPAQPSAKEKKRLEKEARKEAKRAEKQAKKAGADTAYEEVESGSKFLTVLAVIIAIILIILLAVILILQIAPDSGAAAWIDGIIESITSGVSLVSPSDGQFLL